MKAKEYPLLVEAVEVGGARGYNRAHKHIDNPTKENIIDMVVDCVIEEICERFTFDSECSEQ